MVNISDILQLFVNKYSHLHLTTDVLHTIEFEIEQYILNSTGNMVRVTVEVSGQKINISSIYFRKVW